jgi:hypothetical protein
VYFREPGSTEGDEADDPQRNLVRAFREEIEDQQIAFHKSFRTTEEFALLIRSRLLKMVLERSNLTRAELGISLDWAAAYEEEPVFLLAQGPQRLALAEDLLRSDPQQAAALLSGLGAELHDLGLPRGAGELHGVREELPPEVAGELAAWRACARAGEEPERVVAAISGVPQHAQGFPLDEGTLRCTAWHPRRAVGHPDR